MPRVPAYRSQVGQAPLPGARFDTDAPPDAFGAGIARGISAAAATLFDVAHRERQEVREQRLKEAVTLANTRETELLYGDGGAFSRRGKEAINVEGEFLPTWDEFAAEASNAYSDDERLQAAVRGMLDQRRGHFEGRLIEHGFRERAAYSDANDLATAESEQQQAALNYDQPERVAGAIRMQQAALRSRLRRQGAGDEVIVAELAQATSATHALVIGAALAKGDSARAMAYLQAHETELTAEHRLRLDGAIDDATESAAATRILSTYRQDVRAGDRALAGLEQSNLPAERVDGIRRRVREGVNLLHDERQRANVDRIANLEARIATGAPVGVVQAEVASLYRAGALTPSQYGSLIERSNVNAIRGAEAAAAQQEIVAALRDGLPLDPTSSDHRKFLESAFGLDVQRVPVGDAQWQAVALGYAGTARMLPPQASSWLRSAARSPDAALAVKAAQFYGGLEQTSPEAAGSVDTDTRAFLASLASMVEAGANPERAFETARANVFETRGDVLEQRRSAFKELAKGNTTALESFIDRDFDTAFTSQPQASSALTADFERQTGAYFAKVGDIGLARDLAWKDLSRVYGTTRVNGEAVVTAFPVERFGVTPEEVRQELAGYLKGTGQGVSADDVLVIPDGITLRAVNDALTGKAVAPSYKLVTKQGDLVLDRQGVPVRYTLPSGEALSQRVRAAQQKAADDAQRAVDEAKRRRDYLDELEEARTQFPAW